MIKKENLLNRLIKYCKINTRSCEESQSVPSSLNQVDFAKKLTKELLELGFENAEYNEKTGFVTYFLESNLEDEAISLGFIAHYDTADYNSENVNPKIVENYQGQVIELGNGLKLDPKDFPNLKKHIGKTLLTTDGTTLLGSDDKSGVSAIIEASLYLKNNPDIKHGKVCFAFGPDEEIGRGADNFNVEEFGADYAYTVDGGELGELQYENFNAASARVEIKGVNIHPGDAKDKMINTCELAIEFNNCLPKYEVPSMTSGYEGFYFLMNMNCKIDKGTLDYIIRDHDKNIFEHRKAYMQKIADNLNKKYQKNLFSINIKDQYYNMAPIVKKNFQVIEIAKKAMENLKIKPLIIPIRGGTDGSKISFMGLATPNIFTGGENFHGPYEFCVVEDLVACCETIVEIIKVASNEKKK